MKFFPVPLFAVLLLAFSLIGCSAPVCCIQPEVEIVKKKPDIRIVAVGDIMLGTNFPDDRLAPDDGSKLLSTITPVLKDADITFGNLEGVLLEGGEAAKKCKKHSSCYVFRSPPHYAKYLKAAGFDVLSLANNHARDFGEEGRTASMKALDAVGLYHTGRIGDIARWEVKGITVAWIAYAPFGGSYDLLDIPLAVKQIKELSKNSDLVFVSIHAGAEGKDVKHIPFKNEFFFGEDRGDVVKFSRSVIDAGADLVIGHGPHVPRAMELYNNRLIAYSLGNFATYQGIRITGDNGIAPILSITMSADGKFKHGQIVSARQHRPQGTLLDNTHEAAKIIEELTLDDFPATGLHFSKTGSIKPLIIPWIANKK
ncbi:MAG: CapA family protein [Gammaproteobacteria bacterium]|nr:CapA family protein [Gammaproteobacteria bacterium]MCW8986311.1 CapA family protein [Gammaproteobacteria bacterium]MCW9031307.1 CapA family protein [Gammaproteobacteria bacterium]